MNVLVLLLGLAITGFGVLMIVKEEWMWGLTEWSNSFKGVVSERTDNWEIGNAIGGVIAIVVGLGAIVLSFSAK